jgi:hypothetical protein
MDSKRCKVCGEVKPLDDYYRTPGTRDGHRGDCKACNQAEKARRHRENPGPARKRAREWREIPENRDRTKANHERYKADGRKKESDRRSYLKRTYGITLEEYDEMLERQGGRCAICRREPRPDISLHVDHVHSTGALRGLLCFSCNVTVGLIREDRSRLGAIGAYLDEHDPGFAADREAARERLRQIPPPVWKRAG